MKITFLGTGAADWMRVPDDTPELRRNSSALLDEHILLDVGPYAFEQAERFGVDLAKVSDLVLSHSHSDHFSRPDLLRFAECSASGLRIWCNEKAIPAFRLSEEDLQTYRITLCPIKTLEPTDIGSGWRVTGLPVTSLSARPYASSWGRYSSARL